MAATGDSARPVTLTADQARRIGVTFAPVEASDVPRESHTFCRSGAMPAISSSVTAASEFSAESIDDIAAARIAASNSPRSPTGRYVIMNVGTRLSTGRDAMSCANAGSTRRKPASNRPNAQYVSTSGKRRRPFHMRARRASLSLRAASRRCAWL